MGWDNISKSRIIGPLNTRSAFSFIEFYIYYKYNLKIEQFNLSFPFRCFSWKFKISKNPEIHSSTNFCPMVWISTCPLSQASTFTTMNRPVKRPGPFTLDLHSLSHITMVRKNWKKKLSTSLGTYWSESYSKSSKWKAVDPWSMSWEVRGFL